MSLFIGSSLLEQLSAVASVYRSGKVASHERSTSATQFRQLLGAVLLDGASNAELVILRAALAAQAKGLALLRAGTPEAEIAARAELRAAGDLVEVRWLSEQSRILLGSFQQAAEAFIDFRCGRYGEARERVYNALADDERLLSDPRYKVLELHRIQLGHNLARVDAYDDQPERAAVTIAALLSYIEGEREAWPFPGMVSNVSVDELPDEQLADLFTQLTGELALLVLDEPEGEGPALLAPALPHAYATATGRCGRYALAHDWLRLKLTFLEGDRLSFLDRLHDFLPQGPIDGSLLWQAAVVDLYRLCSSLAEAHPHLSKPLMREIEQDAPAWVAPPRLKACVIQRPTTDN